MIIKNHTVRHRYNQFLSIAIISQFNKQQIYTKIE